MEKSENTEELFLEYWIEETDKLMSEKRKLNEQIREFLKKSIEKHEFIHEVDEYRYPMLIESLQQAIRYEIIKIKAKVNNILHEKCISIDPEKLFNLYDKLLKINIQIK